MAPGPKWPPRLPATTRTTSSSTTDLRPGELAIYINYPGRDNYNFDAQDQSFAWLAARRGIAVDLIEIPGAQHNLCYIQRAEPPAFLWLGRHTLAPVRR